MELALHVAVVEVLAACDVLGNAIDAHESANAATKILSVAFHVINYISSRLVRRLPNFLWTLHC